MRNMPETRPKWVEKAAKEIDTLHHDWFFKIPGKGKGSGAVEPDERILAIIAIIDKHRPPEEKHPMYAISRDEAGVEQIDRVDPSEDKVRKLIELLRELLASIVEDWGISERYKIRKKVDITLAEHEKAKK